MTSSKELLPAARNFLATWVKIKAGDRLRIVWDNSVPEIVTDAFLRVSSQRGLKVQMEEVPLGDLASRSIAQLSEELIWADCSGSRNFTEFLPLHR